MSHYSESPIQTHLINLIRQHGPISFKDFMEAALYTPGLGYYRSGQVKFGAEGDFITAPELSRLFSQTFAKSCCGVLQTLSNGGILEIGAGSGVMAGDILLTLEQMGALPDHYGILETSSDLIDLQQTTLDKKVPHLTDRVHWLTQWPTHFQGVVLANEVLDAMPVHLIRHARDQFQEYWVTWDQVHHFQWQLGDLSDPSLYAELAELQPFLNDPHTVELNPMIGPWLQGLSHMLDQGVVLLIDYGFPRHEYYHPQRHMGTLMCHSHHHSHSDPLNKPGFEDITAHVDFTAVAEKALEAGFQVAGFCNQADFLINAGIAELLSASLSSQDQFKQAQQLKMLTLPSEMGELFKVMGLTKEFDSPLMGFAENDQRHRLG